MTVVTALAIAVIFGAGVHLMTRRDVFRVAAGTLLLSNAAVLLLVSSGLGGRRPPILPVVSVDETADPLVQALAITAVVIGFGITVLLLRITLAVERTHHTVDIEDLVSAEKRDEAAVEPEAPNEEPVR